MADLRIPVQECVDLNNNFVTGAIQSDFFNETVVHKSVHLHFGSIIAAVVRAVLFGGSVQYNIALWIEVRRYPIDPVAGEEIRSSFTSRSFCTDPFSAGFIIQ